MAILDEEEILDLNEINKVIHAELVKRGDVNPEDTRTTRTTRKGAYIIVMAHGIFSGAEIIKFFLRELAQDNIVPDVRPATEKEKEFLQDTLPVFKFLNNQYRGGSSNVSDSDTIDPGIEKLCLAFNEIPGIKTFASCDGHHGGRPLYICYTAGNLHTAEIVSYYLTYIIEKYFKQLKINPREVVAKHVVSYMPDGIPTGIYFTFSIEYSKNEADKIYRFANLAAEEILSQIKMNNIGKLGRDSFYHFDPII